MMSNNIDFLSLACRRPSLCKNRANVILVPENSIEDGHLRHNEVMPKQTLEARVTLHDREIAAIRKLIVTGMKLIVQNERGLKELQAAQKKTEQTLERFIRSLERGGGNGHTKARVH